jgi:hypothetical protein
LGMAQLRRKVSGTGPVFVRVVGWATDVLDEKYFETTNQGAIDDCPPVAGLVDVLTVRYESDLRIILV